MNTPTLSIYIPVYNAEKYLETCLDSVLNQTFSDFELYLYNDGSVDRSYSICQRYALEDSRVIFTSGANGSYIDQLNLFIEKAKGQYIGFVDNDDFLDADYFQKMITALKLSDSDCAISSYTLVDSDGKVLPWYTAKLADGTILSCDEVRRRFLTTLDIEGFWWNKIYKKSVFIENNIRFPKLYPEDINGEFTLLSHIEKAILVDHNGYYYRQSPTSEVATLNVEKRIEFLYTYDRIGRMAIADGLSAEGEYYRTWRTVNSLFNNWNVRNKFSVEQWAHYRKECCWRKTVDKSLLRTVKTVNSFPNRRDSAFKFMLKTIIVWYAYR